MQHAHAATSRPRQEFAARVPSVFPLLTPSLPPPPPCLQCLTTKVKNTTRWTGLYAMVHANRLIGPQIRVALTGEVDGIPAQDPAAPAPRPAREDSSNLSDSDDGSDGDDQEEGNRAASKEHPLAHRCLPPEDWRNNDIYESLLDRPREVTLIHQEEREGFGEGLDLGVSFLVLTVMRDEARADRLELVSGAKGSEVWKEASAGSLSTMFKTFRKEFASQLTERFDLDGTPDRHVLLALAMNPSVNMTVDSPQLAGKGAMFELMDAEYTRALRRQAIRLRGSAMDAPTDAPTDAPCSPADAPSPGEPTAAAPVAAPAPGPNTLTTHTPKRRKGLLGAVVARQSTVEAANEEDSVTDREVKAEKDRFKLLREQVLEEGADHPCYEGGSLFNLRKFWAGQKSVLPLHFRAYVAEVAPKKAGAANVETVFSGAGKFMKEAESTGPKLLQRMTKLHYNWKYVFLRPTLAKVVAHYNSKFRASNSAVNSAAPAAAVPPAAAPNAAAPNA